MPVQFTLNQKPVALDAPPEKPLLWALREDTPLTGTKFGCGIAACGACTVLVDGQPVRSCVTKVGDVAGKQVTTIEAVTGGNDRVGRAVRDAWVADVTGVHFAGSLVQVGVRAARVTVVGGAYVALLPAGERPLGTSVIPAERTTVPYSTAEVIEVHSPATGEYVGKVPLAAKADVDAACAAARKAFDEGPWPRMTPQERQAVIANAVKLIEDRADLFKFLLKGETGQTAMVVDMMQYGAAMSVLQFYSSAADKFTWKDIRDGIYGQTLVLKEPIGVVGAVVAWNVPFFLAANKLGPALLAGCTIVLKPASETPLSTNLMAEKFAEAGLPEGVLSVVPGGPETGRALTDNPELDKFTFTGSSAVGKEIGKIAAEKLKPCTLELGGKSAAIILEDADLDSTLPMLLFSGLMNTGQACVGQTRILAPQSRYDEIVEKIGNAVAAMPVGLPDDPTAAVGALISEKQRDRVEGYIKKGVDEGARIVTGGGRPEGLDGGWFVQPTVFDDIAPKVTTARAAFASGATKPAAWRKRPHWPYRLPVVKRAAWLCTRPANSMKFTLSNSMLVKFGWNIVRCSAG